MNDNDLIITLLIGMLAAVPAYVASTGMRKWFQERRPSKMDRDPAKTASVQQVPERWPDIVKWVAAGEEVQMTHHDKVVAKIVPTDNPKAE
jgi:antitoxin (DNA-binding transcriptional repressor) of toxin-antitoxin stability system